MIHMISDEVLDSFSHGWTPELVRRLVAGYRELKAAKAGVDTFCDHPVGDILTLEEDSVAWCSRCGAHRRCENWGEWTRPKGPR